MAVAIADRARLAAAALLLMCASSVRGSSFQVAAAAAHCPSSCLTCDAKGACTSCPANFGLNTAKRCVKCASWACLNCNADYKRCKRCGFGKDMYVATDGTCKTCLGREGPCLVTDTLGCNPDGSCQKCHRNAVRIKGQCRFPPDNCSVKNTLPDGSCKECYLGYVRVAGGTKCKRCPDGCIQCRVNGTCIKCDEGYNLKGGKCLECKDFNCADCTGDVSRCLRCYNGSDGTGLSADGKCVSCETAGCSDCSYNSTVCTGCMVGYFFQKGKCVECPKSCDYKCGKGGICEKCADGYGRVGKDCLKCKVKYCSKCGGNVNRCKVCGDNADYETLFATSDGTRCLKCQAHPQCTRCTSANGACTECSEGWYVSKGTCKKVKPCLVPGCKRCAADPSKCEDCAYQGEDPDECDATWEFDPRTKTCARLGGTLSPFCGGQYD